MPATPAVTIEAHKRPSHSYTPSDAYIHPVQRSGAPEHAKHREVDLEPGVGIGDRLRTREVSANGKRKGTEWRYKWDISPREEKFELEGGSKRFALALAIKIFSAFLFAILLLKGALSLLPQASSSHNPNKALLLLASSSSPSKDRPYKALTSVSNPYGYMSLIDPHASHIFNPTLLSLPPSTGDVKLLLVARGEERYEAETVAGEGETRWQKVVGCSLEESKRRYLNIPFLERIGELHTLQLPAERHVPYLRCREKVYDQFIGPEDPRLFLLSNGAPLLFYSQTGNAPAICRAIFVIDARVVIPGLQQAMERAGWTPDIEFGEQTDLVREGQTNIEKNWAPFLSFPSTAVSSSSQTSPAPPHDLYFHASLVPQQIYAFRPHLTLRPLVRNPPAHNCLSELVGADMGRVRMHHATPLLRVTLCERGECMPDVHNTVLMGIIQFVPLFLRPIALVLYLTDILRRYSVKYHPEPYLFYERRAVTWNATAESEFEYLSVSKPLSYLGTNQGDPIFTVSMAWDLRSRKGWKARETGGMGLAHGFLDDTVLIGFGVGDYGSAFIDVEAKQLLEEHTLCKEL
ncbi:hypothetical protein BT69DRAFT_1347193 [Atractiella rhizophila]|nr:hypothetical protein BT69DRAFT_1347193 [Atractiella rhizophila]